MKTGLEKTGLEKYDAENFGNALLNVKDQRNRTSSFIRLASTLSSSLESDMSKGSLVLGAVGPIS